jgi:hypothetical protein
MSNLLTALSPALSPALAYSTLVPLAQMFLDDDPAAEQYVPCKVVSNFGQPDAELIEGAGCRYKGSVGSLRFCLDPYVSL